ncbi:energy transducer TonB [Catenovulum adriaticum]|uniref:Protein TonB n=1 Tax=Catenovulum adriaticum TaxID=2984846 RepID=A0ABY7AT06_9ALTE|nr:energy transducer TonB [Catenovulum sp. TS8]WAJ71806.1 energy transducer TonB [Catenovulum sp. TS8]
MKNVWLLLTSLSLIACQSTPVPVKPTPNICCHAKKSNEAVQLILRVPPRYPAIAARAGQNGWVQLQFDIDENGNVKNLQVIDYSPEGFNFDKQAYRAVEQWKYKINNAAKNQLVTLEFKLN